MKKILSFVLAAVALVFTACSNDETIETSGNGQNNKGMVLVATVSQQDSRAAINANETFGTWKFTFDVNDNVLVGNNTINDYYTFTKNSDTFSSTDATVTSSPTDWYAYYPGTNIDLTNQEGTTESAAKLYALAGKTAEATTGSTPLQISMDAKAAVLRIVKVDNYGPCDIYLKTKDGKYVSGLKAKNNDAGYDVVTSDTRTSVFYKESSVDYKENKGNSGIYYVIVPAGVYLEVWNDGIKFKTTSNGLKAGKYYTLTSGPTKGTATATINGDPQKIDWVQLWIGGPRFAVKNVNESMTWDEATKKDDDFAWGSNWYVPSEEDLKIMDELLYKVQVNPTEQKVSIAGYPTLELITNTKLEENITKITGFQPGYNENSISLYNKIVGGMNTYRFWTATEKDGYGVEFKILEQGNWFCGGGFSYRTNKKQLILTRPILTAKTILWSEQYVDK